MRRRTAYPGRVAAVKDRADVVASIPALPARPVSFSPILPSINENLWQKLEPELQGKVHDAIEKARQLCDRMNLEAESQLVELFKEEGLTVVFPDKEAFQAHVYEAYLQNEAISADWDMELYRRVKELAE